MATMKAVEQLRRAAEVKSESRTTTLENNGLYCASEGTCRSKREGLLDDGRQ